RDTHDLYDTQLIRELAAHHGFQFVPVLSSPSAGFSNRRGFVPDAVARDFTSLAGFDVYLGGPPAMVEAATELAVKLGAVRVYSDPFHYSTGGRKNGRSAFRALGDIFRSKSS
ncbi:MAG: hypothetical protein ACREV0_05620, partial [Burkholderiales bacterium]